MKRISEEEKRMWLEDWQSSGKTAWAYAKENGLCPQTFVNWTRPETRTKFNFVEVPAGMITPPSSNHEIIIERGGTRIHIPMEPVLDELHKMLSKLGQAL